VPRTSHGAAILSLAVLCVGTAASNARAEEPGGALTAARRPDGTALSADEVLREAGLTDDDESPEAEDLLDDEGIAPSSRRRTAAPKTAPALSAWRPRMTLAFVGWQSSTARAGWQAWVVLTATWERTRPARMDRDMLTAERTRRWMALMVDAQELMARPRDPERDASLAATRDELQALR
jgi:hypothetical protein